MRDWTVKTLKTEITRGDISALEVCEEYLKRINAINNQLNAFTAIFEDTARKRAEEIDRNLDHWRDKPLLGVPVTIKDVICSQGELTTAGSKILSGFKSPYDATVVTRLLDAGAIIVGKTNCDEFAMGSSTEYSAYGPTRNPWSTDCIPGGSSGGAAVAVAARLATVSIGSDTGGSIRQPAALCGIVGLKPTYGRVSRYGLLAFASSLDQIGPLTLTVEDSATVFQVIAGHDLFDATTSNKTVPNTSSDFPGNPKGLRIGVPRKILTNGVDPLVMRAFDKALSALKDLGVTLHDIDLPHMEYAVPVYYLVAPAEASSNLARYDGVRYGFRAKIDSKNDIKEMYDQTRNQGFGTEVKRRIMLGTYVLSAGYYDAYYLKAQRVRSLIGRDYEEAFAHVDVVAMPTTPSAAFRIGEHIDDPLAMYLGDIFTVSANLTGLPAMSLPCGFTDANLPIGFQLIGRPFDEATLFKIADAYEHQTTWHTKQPPSTPTHSSKES
jgi:aspartyl-tRNA(Asn)/glutamyl-tRNA(Gln) amidotransferase subunit A